MPDKRSATKRAASPKSGSVWTEEERAAMQESARERKRARGRSPEDERADGEAEIQAKIAEMIGEDQAMATRVHEIISETVPQLVPRTYYGMPAYAKDGKVICFFQPAAKFKVRYATLGFQPDAQLDDGTMWATSFALLELTKANEAQIVELVRKAAG